MILVVLYAVVNILFSAFAGKKRWKLTAAVHGVMLTLLLGLLAVYFASESAADIVSVLTGNRANAIREALDRIGGAFTLAPVVLLEVALLVQAVISGLWAAFLAVSYIRCAMKRGSAFGARVSETKTFHRAERAVVFAPIRRLWQVNCVMNC